MSIKEPPKSRLARIKSSAFSRGMALAKVSVSAGAKAASHAVGNLLGSEANKADRLKDLLTSQAGLLAKELGQLKGSVMKVGQMLSMYGEQFLPPEANALLKSLQSQSPPLDWSAIEKVLKRQLSPELLGQLEIDPEPIASASLGQVHRARRKSDGRWLALKIQYPGVDQAIDGDLKALKTLLSVSKLLPKGPKYDELFHEVRQMLHQEVDYSRELKLTEDFREKLAHDSRFIIPEVFPEYCTKRVFATSLEVGVNVDGPEVQALSQERRNLIGSAFLDLYLQELFRFQAVQTDPHFGNYKVRLGEGGAPDRLVLFDFGAVRKFPKTFLDPYLIMAKGIFNRNPEGILNGAADLGFILPDDSKEIRNDFVQLCYLFGEPFFEKTDPGVRSDLFSEDGSYSWGESDLPKRVAKQGTQVALAFKFRSPPREVVFLDRKMGGVFIVLSVLKAKIRGKDILGRYI